MAIFSRFLTFVGLDPKPVATTPPTTPTGLEHVPPAAADTPTAEAVTESAPEILAPPPLTNLEMLVLVVKEINLRRAAFELPPLTDAETACSDEEAARVLAERLEAENTDWKLEQAWRAMKRAARIAARREIIASFGGVAYAPVISHEITITERSPRQYHTAEETYLGDGIFATVEEALKAPTAYKERIIGVNFAPEDSPAALRAERDHDLYEMNRRW